MGTSFVSIKSKGFWVRDGLLELWLRLLSLHIEETPEKASIARKIRDDWMLASRGYFSGAIPDNLEEAVSTNEGKDIVTKAISSLIKALVNGPKNLNAGTLNLLGIEGGYFTADLESQKLVEIGNSFLALIEGKIQTDSSSSQVIPD